MTPAKSYRVLFRESLGTTVTRMMARGPDGVATSSLDADVLTSASEDSEYADMGPGIVESVAQMLRHRHRGWRAGAPRAARLDRAAGTGCARSSSRRSTAWMRGTSWW